MSGDGANDEARGGDLKAARQTYDGFLGLTKWTVIVVALIAALVVKLLSS